MIMNREEEHVRESVWGKEIKKSFIVALLMGLLTFFLSDGPIRFHWRLMVIVTLHSFFLSAWFLVLRRKTDWGKEIKVSVMAAIWMCLLTFPMVVFKVNPSDGTIIFRWHLMVYVAFYSFFLSAWWRWFLVHRDNIRQSKVMAETAQFEAMHQNSGTTAALAIDLGPKKTWVDMVVNSRYRNLGLGLGLAFLAAIPFFGATPYMINTAITALIYITLGLGLNIVVGVSGLLNLGYVAFYAIGAYTYALLNHYFGFGFWICLPLGALTATILGLLLGFPVLRLRGDYLAIVTLGFGEIVRLLLLNMGDITRGPRGVANISPPGFFGIDLNASVKPMLIKFIPFMNANLDMNKVLLFLIILALVIITILAVFRLENSRLGRAWLALREDEIACQAMGIDRTKTKLTAFALGATWAGMAGVVFSSQLTFINPTSFTFMQSVMVLSIVVLGGMGSIPGVIIGAVVLIVLPESLRAFSDYRMLLFGAAMVLMMVFRPGGLIQSVRQAYVYKPVEGGPTTDNFVLGTVRNDERTQIPGSERDDTKITKREVVK